jgi:(2Fe-2S) ferredoxin
MTTSDHSVIICINRSFSGRRPACADSGSEVLAEELEQQLANAGLAVEVRRITCLGQCEQGPNLRIAPGGRFFHQVSHADLPVVVTELQRLMQVQ